MKLLLLLFIMTFVGGITMNADTLYIGKFSEMNPDEKEKPEGWDNMDFRGISATEYKLVEFDGRNVVKAKSEQSSSGLIFREQIDLKEYPIIEWEWYVENIMEKGDVTKEDGDDYPARIYVMFDYDLGNLSWRERNTIRALRAFYGEVPSRAINYIYANHAELDKVVPNPYTDLVTMWVVDTGEENLRQWKSYRRNIYEDYKEIYGEEPPPVEGVAIMTDSDDTGEEAMAYFGDIRFLKE